MCAPGQIPPELNGRIDRLAVPILVDGQTLIQDSADIIRHLDTHGAPMLQSYGTSHALEEWRTSIAAPLSALCYPRMPQLNVPELASPDALAFFESTMPKRIGMSFDEALAQTSRFARIVEAALPGVLPFLELRNISFDTLAALADLRSLTMVAEISFPEQVLIHFNDLIARAGVKPFTPVTAKEIT
ncbi:glutathione S-transferase N-terminal domain-containing protein [Leisingera aquimarina]|uniref:glutathione S-transferase N-terminal domain-containing protein n=1 Tax=Leisingera aquimarina TaxID=476529 RepID=UPI0003F8C0CB|nr:glutathione S-transferase N-terminal domain-containing protein [Leisingera aquimarina]